MLVGIFPAHAVGAEDLSTTDQIGDHYEADNDTGSLASSPTLTGDTSKSYANGSVLTNKTIKAGDNENEFLITLDVRTTSEIENITFSADAAVVIVLDLSYSMKDDNKLENAKQAIIDFIQKFTATESVDAVRKVAIVGFSGEGSEITYRRYAATTYKSWTSTDTIESVLDGMNVGGETDIQAGLILAKNLLDSDEVSGITNKSIVLLTDGLPNRYLSDTEQNSTSTEQITSTNWSQDKHNVHTKTEATGKSILESGISVYSIYLGNDTFVCSDSENCGLNKSGAEWLREDCGFITYSADDASELESIYEDIEDVIEKHARAWIVDDPLGAMFEFDGFSETPDDPNEYYYNDAADNITWNLRLSDPVEEENGYKVYQLAYKVKLNTLASGYAEGTFYPTNEVTSVDYFIEQESTEGTSQIDYGTAYFNVPSAKGYAADISFDKVDNEGNSLEGAEFKLTTTDDPNWSMTAVSDENGVVEFKDVPSGHTYTLAETSAPSGYIQSEDTYTITVSYGDVSSNIGTNNTVANVPEIQYGGLTVSKTVSGSGADSSQGFAFTVTLDDDSIAGEYGGMAFGAGVASFTLKDGEALTATGLPAGTGYTVTEGDNDGYAVTVNGTAETTAAGTIAAGETAEAAFNNYRDAAPDPETGSLTVSKTVTGDNAPSDDVAYEFKIWVRNSSGTAVSESVSYRIAHTDGTTTTGSLTIGTDGYTFYLKDGESITFSSITSGRRIEVTEISTGDFTTTTSGLADGVCVISSNTTKSVEFVNDYGDTTTLDDDPDPDDPTATTPSPDDSTPTDPGKSLDNIPQTGDDTNVGTWIALAGFSLFGMLVAALIRKRYRHNPHHSR